MGTKKLIEEEFDMRPQSKPDASVRGRLLKWKNSDYVAFEPQKARETPARTVLKEKKGGCFYKNEGEKENSFSLHVNVDGSEKYPAYAALEKAQEILKPLMKEEPKLNVKKFFEDTPELKVWHRKSDKQLCAMITIDCSATQEKMSSQLFRAASEINKIINANKFA